MEEWGRYVAPVRSVASVDSDPTLTVDPGASASVTPEVSYFGANLRGRDFVQFAVHSASTSDIHNTVKNLQARPLNASLSSNSWMRTTSFK